jgi:hypothetical protein
MVDPEQIPSQPEKHEDAAEQGGVFGKLPGSRPGVRSPRRGNAGATGRAGAAAEPAGERGRSVTESRAEGTQPPRGRTSGAAGRPPPAEPETPPPAGGERGGVEDLAWAGIAVAAEAATLGVRLLSRAVESVRRPPDRR